MYKLSRQIDIGGIEQYMASASLTYYLEVCKKKTTRYLDRKIMANITGKQLNRDPFLDVPS